MTAPWPAYVFVTGSRSLVEVPGAEVATKAIIAPYIDAGSVLYTGDASGPDFWAWELAEARKGPRHCYALDGSLWLAGPSLRWTDEEAPSRGDHEAWKAWCLRRDRVAVDAFADALAMACESAEGEVAAVVLAFTNDRPSAPGVRRTRGTEYTARYAEETHGLKVVCKSWV